MQRARDDGGLGTQLVGDRIQCNHRCVQATKLLGEGGFSYVYLVKEISTTATTTTATADGSQQTYADSATVRTLSSTSNTNNNGGSTSRSSSSSKGEQMVLKVTSIHSRQQRDIAEKEAKLLSRLSHPSIIKMYDACYRTVDRPLTAAVGGTLASMVVGGGGGGSKEKEDAASSKSQKDRPQHLMLLEYCEGGHALDVCNKLAAAQQCFDLSSLIIAFGQICNAVSYLHAQRPPIVHRDLKPVNFLVKNGAYKLCDFGSAVFGHVELTTPKARMEAEEVISKTTTQMFRAPEMVDLYMSKKLTQSTDVWALGCCLYSLAFLQNCFEEGSNLAILSRNYKIPEDNPYGDGLVELIDRMLTVDCKGRADMTEVILCLSAIYSGRPLPPRKKSPKHSKKPEGAGGGDGSESNDEGDHKPRGTYRTDGQGIRKVKPHETKRPVEAKPLNPDSAAYRRRRAARSGGADSPRESATDGGGSALVSPTTAAVSGSDAVEFHSDFATDPFSVDPDVSGEFGYSSKDNPFAGLKADADPAGKRITTDSAFPRFPHNSFESGEGSGSGDGMFSFEDGGWTRPKPEDIPDSSFPKFSSPHQQQQDAARSTGGRSGSTAADGSMENLSLSHHSDSNSNSDPKDRKHRRNTSSSRSSKGRKEKPSKGGGRSSVVKG